MFVRHGHWQEQELVAGHAAKVRYSLGSVLRVAGVGYEADQTSVHLDLSALDGRPWAAKREQALLTTASLLFQLGDDVEVFAKLPASLRSRRVLAASGVMFALAQHHAVFDDTSDAIDVEGVALFDASPLRRFAGIESWRDTYTPFDPELRDLMLPAVGTRPDSISDWSRWNRGVGVFDDDFAAFVNPHRLPAGTELQAISGLAKPWFERLIAEDRENDNHIVETSMEFLGHALDNVREYAFDSQISARSLVTLGRVYIGEIPFYRLQILDNGVGIPASLAAQIGTDDNWNVEQSKELLNRVVHGTEDGFEPLLPMGRNIGLPSMRHLTGELGGRLWIVTRGPDGSQIAITCDGSQASPAVADLVPVAGTVVSLIVPLQSNTDEAVSAIFEQQTLDL